MQFIDTRTRSNTLPAAIFVQSRAVITRSSNGLKVETSRTLTLVGVGGATLVTCRCALIRNQTCKMGIISVYIVNKAGGLIFSHDQPSESTEVEATFSYPLCMVLEEVDRNIVVKFGERQGVQGNGVSDYHLAPRPNLIPNLLPST